MNRMRANGIIAVMVAAILATGCHKGVSAQNQSNDLGPDPAAANMAPGDPGSNEAVSAAQTAQPPANQTYQQDQSAPPDQSDQSVDQGYAAVDDSNDVDYDDADAQADQAPPPLPDYVQPPLPGDGYIWTPGYWASSPDGYYWVPGAWTMPPYEGALWTPGWWGFHGGRYFFFRGYWGHYIGYYGGINYGFGYAGRGYEGGYWRGNRFQYNNTVNVIRITNVNVYSHPVAAPSIRVSFNGPGGAHLRPAPAELNAMRQPRVAPMSTQVQAQRSAQQDRAQFANVNHGRPATVVAPRPITADTRTQSLPPARIQPQQQPRRGNQMQGPQNRPAPQSQPQQQPRQFQMQQSPQQQQHFTPQSRPAPQQQQFTPQSRPAPQSAPNSFVRPAPQPEAHPQDFARPAPQPEAHPDTFARPAPQAEPRPAPQPQPHPAPQARPEPVPHPAPAPQQHSAPQGGDGHDDHHQ
jgi:hypothetical protein